MHVRFGIPRLSERKESVTTSTLVSGGAVTLLCVLIPNPARPGDRLAGVSKLKYLKIYVGRHRLPGSLTSDQNPDRRPAALIHKAAHTNVHRHTQSQESE